MNRELHKLLDKVQVIKINGKKYVGDAEEWELLSVGPDEADKGILEDIKNDKFPVTECKISSSKPINGKKVNLLEYTFTMAMGDNVMKSTVKQYTGIKDGLVYKEEKTFMGKVAVTEYKYTDIKAPKIK